MSRLIETLRRLKITYSLYNFFHKKELVHNLAAYKKLGLNKKYYSPVSSRDFKDFPVQYIEDNHPGYRVEETDIYKETDDESRNSLSTFSENGFALVRNFLSSEQADKVNEEIDRLLEEGKVKFRYRNKIMFAFHKSKIIQHIGLDQKLLDLLKVFLGGKVHLFSSINFLMGSQQKAHSDSIHMTTYPLGGLLGVWIALEDISSENGPLSYYPGSHKLPYYLNSEYDNEGNWALIGKKLYHEYEEMLATKLSGKNMEKKIFKAKKGDMLIWHANLIHGGEPHLDKSKTRKSMVFHYFKDGVVCYHEISQRPALIKSFEKV